MYYVSRRVCTDTFSLIERDISQEGNPVICTPWVPIHLSYNRLAGATPDPSLSLCLCTCSLLDTSIAGSGLPMRWERFRGTQKVDDRGLLKSKYSILSACFRRMWENVTTKGRMHLPCKHWHNGGLRIAKQHFPQSARCVHIVHPKEYEKILRTQPKNQCVLKVPL